MKNNILGGLVIFVVVVTCLLLIDDISNSKEVQTTYEKNENQPVEGQTDLAIVEEQE